MSISYVQTSLQKSASNEPLEPEKTDMVNKHQHIIHKAVGWKKILDDGEAGSLSEIAEKHGLTRAKVTQIMNLLKLSPEWKNFLLGLTDPKEIRRYPERRLRNYHIGGYEHLQRIGRDGNQWMSFLKRAEDNTSNPPRIKLVEIHEPLPIINPEAQKKLIQKAAIRKLKNLDARKKR